MSNRIVIPSLSEIDAAADEFLRRIGEHRLIAFHASMGAGKEPVYHFDFYRITKPAEALDIGLYDYLDSGALCLMEWPENIEDLLPEETLPVSITVDPDGTRTLSWEEA